MTETNNPASHQSGAGACILYAEDEPNDIFFLQYALEIACLPHTLNAVSDGEQAIEYLAGKGPFADRARHPLPALILLDINMPKKTGLEVLEWIRQQPSFKSLPVLMLTSSARPEDLERARALGADDYLSKPSAPRDLVEVVKSLDERWLSKRAISDDRSSAASTNYESGRGFNAKTPGRKDA